MSARTRVQNRRRRKARPLIEPLERRTLLTTSNLSSNPSSLTAFNGLLYFAADDGLHGVELWKSDGAPGGSSLVKDIRAGGTGSAPDQLVVAGDTLFFTANDGVHGRQLWKTDGTASGTAPVTQLNSSDITSLTPVGDDVYFLANNQLWISDGTLTGTTTVSNVPNYTFTSNAGLAVLNGELYFAASDPSHGVELWKTDGTPSGTTRLTDLNPTGDAYPYELFATTDALYFWATDGLHGFQLFKSDSTGTTLLKDLHPGGVAGGFGYFTPLGPELYFVASDTSHGTELWKTDGTSAGTVLVKDILPGPTSSYPTALTAFDGAIYFRADNGADGEELWRSDGADSGTTLFKDIRPGPLDSNVTDLLVSASILYFRVESDGTSAGSQLWRSDGTPTGTTPIPGATLTSEDPGVDYNGLFYFPGYDPQHGVELWKSNGITAEIAADINAAPASIPTLHIAPASDTGPSQTDAITQNTLPTLTGIADPLTMVCLLIDGSLVAAPLSDADGLWTFVLTDPLSEGTHSATAFETGVNGNGPTSAPLTILIDNTPPTPSLTPITPPANHAPSIDFTLTYTDAAPIDLNSIGDDDLTITGPNGFTATATRISATPSSGGKKITALYRLTPPVPFTVTSNGTYTISLAPNTIQDAAGNAAPSATLGAFTVNLAADAPPPDITAPTATLQSITTPTLDARYWDITLTLSDDRGIDPSSLADGDIFLAGPNAFTATGTLLSYTPSSAIALFRITAPGGFFDPSDNGAYTLSLPAGAFADTSGNPNTPTTFAPLPLNLSAPPSTPDLGGVITSAPATIQPNSKSNAVTLKLSNIGTRPFGGKITVKLYAMPAESESFDPAAAISLGSTTPSVIIAAKGSTTTKVTFNAPPAITGGDYRIVALLDPGKSPELYKSNNTLLSSKTTRFIPPTADLAVTFKKSPATIGKKKTPLQITLTNKGNTPATGPAIISLFASPNLTLDDTLDTLLSKKTQSLSLKPGKSLTLTLTITSPPSNTTQYLAASLSFTGRPTDPNPTNNLLFSKSPIRFT